MGAGMVSAGDDFFVLEVDQHNHTNRIEFTLATHPFDGLQLFVAGSGNNDGGRRILFPVGKFTNSFDVRKGFRAALDDVHRIDFRKAIQRIAQLVRAFDIILNK